MLSEKTRSPCPWCLTAEHLYGCGWGSVFLRIACRKCGCTGPKECVTTPDEAWAAWDAWCNGEWVDKPTEPGWYFYRASGFKLFDITYISDSDIRYGWFLNQNTHEIQMFREYAWQGPIKPKE